jgi:hypothetical protein
MRNCWLSVLLSSAVLLAGAAASAQGKQPATKEPATAKEPRSGKNSRLTVRCSEECTVKLAGQMGLRQGQQLWEFKDVEPGKQRLDATGKLLVMEKPLYGGYVEVPPGVHMEVLVDSRNRVTVTDTKPLAAEPSYEASKAGAPSILNVRCKRPCTLLVDRVRRGASSTQNVVIPELQPGSHDLEAQFILGKTTRGSVDVPPGSEVFVYATDNGLQITNTQPLRR